MNKKIMTLAAVASMGFIAQADVLYWQVNQTEAESKLGGTPATAYLMATADGDSYSPYYVQGNLNANGTDISTAADGAVGYDTFANGGYAAGVLDLTKILSWSDGTTSAADNGVALSSLSFFIELYDSSGVKLGNTDAVAYNQLGNAVSSGFNANFTGVNSALGTAQGSSYAVPEPTSGLLMLVGFGALALRRRKVA